MSTVPATASISNAAAPAPAGKEGVVQPPLAPAEAPKPFTVPERELKKITLVTAEKEARVIELSDATVATLVNTLTSHFQRVDKLKKAATPQPVSSLHNAFYETFSKLYPAQDLSDPEKLRAHAREFLERGGSEVLVALRLAQWEMATLQAASGRRLIAEGQPEFRDTTGKEIVLVTAEDGSVTAETKTEKVPNPQYKGRLDALLGGEKRKFLQTATRTRYKITGNKHVELNRTINGQLSPEQVTFLEAMGLASGDLDPETLATLDERLGNLTASITELYVRTGCPLTEVNPNYIELDTTDPKKPVYKYRQDKKVHFLGDQAMAPGDVLRDVLEAEGKNIAVEIKTDVQKKLDDEEAEAKSIHDEEAKQAKRTRREGTASEQLNKEIEKKRQSTPSAEAQQIARDEIDKELARLKKDIRTLTGKGKLDIEVSETQTEKDEALRKLEERQGIIEVPDEKQADINLADWSNPNKKVSWKQYESIYKRLSAKRKKAEDRIAGLKHEMEIVTAGGLKRTEVRNEQTQSTQVTEPISETRDRFVYLQGQINDVTKQIYDGTPSLEQQIEEAEAIYLRRQAACTANDEVITAYQQAEKKLQDKKALQAKNKKEFDLLFPAGTPSTVDIQTKLKATLTGIDEQTQKLADIGKAQPETQIETQTLKALKGVLPPEGRQDRNARLTEAGKDLLPLDIVENSPWADFPPAILRSVQIMFGSEIFLPAPPDKDLAAQVLTLLKSKKYLDIFINAIDANGAVMAAPLTDGAYTDINAVLPAGIAIRTFAADKIDAKIIDTVVEKMRLTAFGLKTIT